jgi:hypothetical protein
MDLAKLNVLYNCSNGYYRGGDVPSPVSEAANEVASEQDRLSESVMIKGTLPAKFENELLSESGIESDTFPPESGKDISSADYIAKPGQEKETSPLESEENISPAGLFSKPKIKRETFITNFGNNLSSEENLFPTSGRDRFIR